MRISLEYSAIQEDVFHVWNPGVKYKTVRKGRRAGFTKGAANAVIDWMVQGISPILWGDTIGGNIQRYFERYFEPELQRNNITYKWDKMYHQLRIGHAFCDFRSADRPENWEGFGYKYIILNEAGIILKDRDLYLKTVLPMLIDFADARLIAGGVPKGKITKDGNPHIFYQLCQREGSEYHHYKCTAFDNPWLSPTDIKALEQEMAIIGGQSMVEQEVYGEFVDVASQNPFATQWNDEKHGDWLRYCQLKKDKILYLSIDFNINPFALTAWHIWEDHQGQHVWCVDEIEIPHGNIIKMAQEIQLRWSHWVPTLYLTGDAMGKRKDIGQIDHASNYTQLKAYLGLVDAQLVLPPNPTHENSRADVNYVLFHHPDFQISRNCPNTQRDFKIVEVDSFGQIKKENRNIVSQRADLLDTARNLINTFLTPWIEEHKNNVLPLLSLDQRENIKNNEL